MCHKPWVARLLWEQQYRVNPILCVLMGVMSKTQIARVRVLAPGNNDNDFIVKVI